MQIAARLGNALLGKDADCQAVRGASRVARGVADVELDRKAELVSKAELATEGELLRLLVDLVVGAEIKSRSRPRPRRARWKEARA